MPEAPSSKGTCGSEIPGLGGQTASLAAKRVSGLRKGDGVLLPQHHTHTCAHKYLRVHMRVCPHAVHMHTLSPEVELPPARLSGDPPLHHPSGASLPSSPPSLLQNLLQAVRAPIGTTCVSVVPGESEQVPGAAGREVGLVPRSGLESQPRRLLAHRRWAARTGMSEEIF